MADVLSCQFTHPTKSCARSAAYHLLIDDDHVSRTCTEHLTKALRQLNPIDYHEHGELCWLSTLWEPRLRWRWSKPDEPGCCYLEGEDDAEQVESRELVMSGTRSPDSVSGDTPTTNP